MLWKCRKIQLSAIPMQFSDRKRVKNVRLNSLKRSAAKMLSRAADAISVQLLGSRNSNAETKNYIVHSKVSFWILQLQRLKAYQFFFTAEEMTRFTVLQQSFETTLRAIQDTRDVARRSWNTSQTDDMYLDTHHQWENCTKTKTCLANCSTS